MNRRTARHVAPVAFLGGNGEDLAAGLERRTNARGREHGVADHGRDFLELRACPREVARHVDGELFCLSRLCIDEMDEARLLVHDRAGTRRRVLDVEVIVVRELL